MTSYEQLLRYLRAVVAASPDPSPAPTPATTAAAEWLRDFRATRLTQLPLTPLEALASGEGRATPCASPASCWSAARR